MKSRRKFERKRIRKLLKRSVCVSKNEYRIFSNCCLVAFIFQPESFGKNIIKPHFLLHQREQLEKKVQIKTEKNKNAILKKHDIQNEHVEDQQFSANTNWKNQHRLH